MEDGASKPDLIKRTIGYGAGSLGRQRYNMMHLSFRVQAWSKNRGLLSMQSPYPCPLLQCAEEVKFQEKMSYDNFKQRRIVRFTIDPSIVDQRVLEEGDVQEELLAIQEMRALVVEPLCCFCHKKKRPMKLLSEDVTVIGLSITSSVHGKQWE